MNTIITVKRLVEMLATQANMPVHTAQSFIEIFTYEIKEGLAQDKSVKIKDLGEFKVENDKIIFVPEPSFAQTINAPFAMFEPEELAEGITTQELSEPIAPVVVPEAKEVVVPNAAPQTAPIVDEIQEPETVVAEIKEPVVEEIKEPEPVVEEIKVAEPMVEEVKVPEPIVEEFKEPEPVVKEFKEPKPVVEEIKEPEPVVKEAKKPEPVTEKFKRAEIINEPEPEPMTETEEEKEYSFPTFWVIIGLVTGLILGIGIGFFVHDPIQEMLEPTLAEEEIVISDEELAILDIFAEDSTVEASAQNEDKVGEVEATPAAQTPQTEAHQEKEPASTAQPASANPQTASTAQPAATADTYDTVTTNLAALSKKHYGDKAYWVYIYLENKDKIPNPNRVGANIRLKIPPLEKYATQATEAERKAAANKKATEILNKYK